MMKYIFKQNYRVAAMLLLLTVTLFSSCKKDDKVILYGPDGKPIEYPGQIIIDPSGLPPGEPVDILTPDGEKIGEVPTGVEVDVEAGTYKLVVVTPKMGLTVDGTVATINGISSDMIPMAPIFRAGVATITVAKGKVETVSLHLRQMTRVIEVLLSLNGFGDALPTSIEASISNVAVAADVEKLFSGALALPKGSTAATTVTPAPPATDFAFNLLGFASPADATLTIHLTFASGDEEIVTQNISAVANDFNRGPADVPMELSMVISKAAGKLSGTVTGWRTGCEGDVTGE